jgi:hypothetical protein
MSLLALSTLNTSIFLLKRSDLNKSSSLISMRLNKEDIKESWGGRGGEGSLIIQLMENPRKLLSNKW